MKGSFHGERVGDEERVGFFVGLHRFVFYSEWTCADCSGFTGFTVRKWIMPLFFFLKSELIFRGAYNGVQRRSRSYYALITPLIGKTEYRDTLPTGEA